MKKILITSPFMTNGGVAQFVNNLSPFFKKDTIIFYRGKRKPKSYFDFAFPLIDVVRFFGFIILKRPKKVIVNSSLAKIGIIRDGLFIIISNLFGAKTILYIHGFDERAIGMIYFLNKGYFKADKIFVLSSQFKEKLRNSGCKTPISVSNNPVNLNLIEKPIKKINKDIKTTFRILMMSRIVKSKGIFIGLEAFSKLTESELELHIAGGGPDLEEAKEFARNRQLKKVFFHGFVSGKEKEELLESSDILLFPTMHNEGLPINILEALVMGIYVVTRPVAGIKDLNHKFKMSLTESQDYKIYKDILDSIVNSKLPEKDIIKNQSLARTEFSPKLLYHKIVLDS